MPRAKLSGSMVLALLVAAGCGGGLSKDEYAKEVAAVVEIDKARALQERFQGATESGNREEAKAALDEANADNDADIEALEGLEPPEELVSAHERLIDTARDAQANSERAAQVIGESNPEELAEISAEGGRIEREFMKLEADFAGTGVTLDFTP